MKKKYKVVCGLYKSRDEIDIAVKILRNDGFATNHISVLLPDSTGAQNFSHKKSSKISEGAVLGGGVGLLLGALLGFLVASGYISWPGTRIIVELGPLQASFLGVGLLGLSGAVCGAFIGHFIPIYVAQRHSEPGPASGILLSVDADDKVWLKKAKLNLRMTGAYDIAVTTGLVSIWGAKKTNRVDHSEKDTFGYLF